MIEWKDKKRFIKFIKMKIMMNEKEYFILIKLFFVSKQMKRRKEIFTAIVYMYIIDKFEMKIQISCISKID